MKFFIDNWIRSLPFLILLSCIFCTLIYLIDGFDIEFFIWLALPALFIHQAEEYLFVKYNFFRDYFNKEIFNSEQKKFPLTDGLAFYINVIFGWSVICFANLSGNVYFILFAVSMLSVNGIFHIIAFIRAGFKKVPGLYSSIFILIPYGLFILFYFLKLGLISSYFIYAFFIIGFLLNVLIVSLILINYKLNIKKLI